MLQKKRINQDITRAAEQKNLNLLLSTVQGHLPEMNAVNMSTALHRLTKQVCHMGPAAIHGLKMHPTFMQLDNQIRYCILNGARSEEMKPYGFSVVTWSYAVLNKVNPELFAAIENITMTLISDLKPFELANLAWGFAKIKQGSPKFFKVIAERLLQRASMEFCLQDLAMIAWSFATAEQEGNAVQLMFASIAKEMVSRAEFTSPQEISITLWAFAKNQYKDIDLFQAFANRMTKPHALDNFKPQELSNMAWAFATLSLRHFTLFRHIAEICVVKSTQMQPQAVANILWAFAKLQIDEPCSQALFRTFLKSAEHNMAEYKQCELTAAFWAASIIVPKCEHCRGFFHAMSQYCQSRSADFASDVLARLLGAAALLEGDLTYVFEVLAITSMRRLSSSEPVLLCSLLRGHALAIHQQQDMSQAVEFWQRVHAIMHAIHRRLPEMSSSDLMHICTSLEDLQKFEFGNLPPMDGSLLEAIQDTVVQNWGRLSNRNLRQLVSTLLKFPGHLRPELLRLCAKADFINSKDQAVLQKLKPVPPEPEVKDKAILPMFDDMNPVMPAWDHQCEAPLQTNQPVDAGYTGAVSQHIRPPPGLEDLMTGGSWTLSSDTNSSATVQQVWAQDDYPQKSVHKKQPKNSFDFKSDSTTCSSHDQQYDDVDDVFQNSMWEPDTGMNLEVFQDNVTFKGCL
jgi:hypothetical protein